jgi:hypothetical protein
VRIDCDECVMQHTSACDDCIVTALIDRPAQGAVVLDLDHERAIRRLQDEGLAPRSRFQGRESGDGVPAAGG